MSDDLMRNNAVRPVPRMSRPGLVSALDLAAWAHTVEAESAFPLLMRRLLNASPGVSGVNVPAGEGVRAGGWDGRAISEGNKFLPAGKLLFEFGTGQRPKSKAEEDYTKRAREDAADSIFIFATPQNWPGAVEWASEKATEGVFADVLAFDAHFLEGWLQATPSVHWWLSDELGFGPGEVETLADWWENFSDRTAPVIPASFHLAGRGEQVAELAGLLSNAPAQGSVITLEAPWLEEMLAFIYGALNDDSDLLERIVIVHTNAAWHRMVNSPAPVILIPKFDADINLHRAAERGHHVMLLNETSNASRRDANIKLGKIGHVEGHEALEGVISDFRRISDLVSLARRSMSALYRELSRDPRLVAPDWASQAESAQIVAPLMLVGAWVDSDGDWSGVEQLTTKDRATIERHLVLLSARSDAPFVKIGHQWKLTAPVEAARLLVPRLIEDDLKRWSDLIIDVLLQEDPLPGLSSSEQFLASIQGVQARYSGALIAGLADSLALVAASGMSTASGRRVQQDVERIVSRLLQHANSDSTVATWSALAKVLPRLAEAAPDVFLDAVESNLDSPDPTLKDMFQDKHSDVFGPSSPHIHLLWGLENLCWKRSLFGRVVALMARLAQLDPGGRLANRPMESLTQMTIGWITNSGAAVDEKLTAIERLLNMPDDEVGWNLLLAVWPTNTRATAPHLPEYRDWMPESREVTVSEYQQYLSRLLELTVHSAGHNINRWQLLVPKIMHLPEGYRNGLIEALKETVSATDLSPENQYAIWRVLSESIANHQEFPHAPWAWSSDELVPLQDIAAAIEPVHDVRRYVPLFEGRIRGHQEDLLREQAAALDKVLALELADLEKLIHAVPRPHYIGWLLGSKDNVPERSILLWLQSDSAKLQEAAASFIGSKLRTSKMDWLLSLLNDSVLTNAATIDKIMAQVPVSKEYWDLVASLDSEIEMAFWRQARRFQVLPEQRQEAIGLLVRFDRAWAAAELMAQGLEEDNHRNLHFHDITNMLHELVQTEDPIEDATMSGYYVGKLLDYLEDVTPEDPALAKFELYFFNLLRQDRHPAALYRALCSDSRLFVELVKARFTGNDEEPKDIVNDRRQAAYAEAAWHLLNGLPVLPGQREDNSIDAVHLGKWVNSARSALTEAKRARVGDNQVGLILSASPLGTDGHWPAEPVRDVIEEIQSGALDEGLRVGRLNRRGITTRNMFEGGAQEHKLEAHYRGMATALEDQWPRTARILRRIAEDYNREARAQDDSVDNDRYL